MGSKPCWKLTFEMSLDLGALIGVSADRCVLQKRVDHY